MRISVSPSRAGSSVEILMLSDWSAQITLAGWSCQLVHFARRDPSLARV